MGMRHGAKALGIHGVFAAVLLPFAVGIGIGCEPARTARMPTVSVRVRGEPPDAAVLIDDNALGTLDFVAAHGVALVPGTHRVTVAASGYFPWDQVVEAKVGSGPISLQVTLIRIPD
jgi:PEGA domain